MKLLGRNRAKKKRALAAVIGGVILFSIIFTVGFGYFFISNSEQELLAIAQRTSSNFLTLKGEENLYITTNLVGGNLTFGVNNTGIQTVLSAYFVTDQSGNVLSYKSGSSQNPPACGALASLPCQVSPGGSTLISSKITYVTGNYYTMRVITGRGNTIVGTYPTQTLTENSIHTLVASGLGSLQMIFSSFAFYNYSSGGTKVNLTSAQTAAIVPFSKPMVMSAQITNNDPNSGTIVVDSHTDLWTFLSCSGGCGTQALITFFVMNVGSDGTIASTTQGSYVPIQIPYGQTKTVFFGSSVDLSLGNYAEQSVSDAIGEHDVFMIFSGTVVSSKNSTLYSQNLPFSATFVSDNIATYSSTPTTCANGSQTIFTLTITNTKWTPSSDGINTITVSAPMFNPSLATAPNGWTPAINSGTITWTAGSGFALLPGQTMQVTWTGMAPIVGTGVQETFISTVTWSGGAITSQPITTGCFVG